MGSQPPPSNHGSVDGSTDGSTDESGNEDPEHLVSPNRPLTIDDVPRLGSGAGIAMGCGVAVAVAIALFWLVRGWLLRAP